MYFDNSRSSNLSEVTFELLCGMPKISRSYFKFYEKTSWKVENSNTTLLSRSFSHVNLDFLNYGFMLIRCMHWVKGFHIPDLFLGFSKIYLKTEYQIYYFCGKSKIDTEIPTFLSDFFSCLIISKLKQLFLILLLCTAIQN